MSKPTQVVSFLPLSCSGNGVPGYEVGVGFKVNVSSTAQSENTLEQVLQARPGSSTKALVLLMQLERPLSEFPDRGLVAQWIPEQNKAEVRQEIAEPGFSGFHTIVNVSHSAALVNSFLLSRESGRLRFKSSGALVPLQGDSAASIFPDTDVFDFVVLEPALLYNVDDLKFYSKEPSPRRTVLPATLAPVEGFTDGDYHLMTVQ